MTGDHLVTILVTFVGFMGLAAALLIPVYRFLKKEEQISQSWTRESLEEQARSREAEAAKDED